MEPLHKPQNRKKPARSLAWTIAESAAMALLGFAAVAIPLHLVLRRELKDAPEDIRAQGWPIRLMQVMFARYVLRWIEVEGLENLPKGAYVVAANHAYKSGVDGFILGHLLATRAYRVPRILITADSRNQVVRAERWLLHHYGIALLVPSEPGSHSARRTGLVEIIAAYLKESAKHTVLIFPAGRAIADPARQLKDWSTGAVVAAMKSRCPVVPIAIGGLKLDWTPETVIFSAMEDAGPEPPFRIHVRIGKPIEPTGDPHPDIDRVRDAVAELMEGIPGLRPAPGESDPAFGKITLRDGRTLAYTDRGPRTGTPVLYFHGFQGSRLEHTGEIDEALARVGVRLIAPDRPGIGLSTPLSGRTMTGRVDDVRQLTEHVLGPGAPFSILGFSAGGTYALACGQLPGLQSVCLVSGMGLPHLITTWRRYSREAVNILFSAKLATVRSAVFLRIERKHHKWMNEHWESYFSDVLKGLCDDDRRILSQADTQERFRQNRRESYSQGEGCMLRDIQALYSDPEIDLTHLAACSVLMVHGQNDKVVPVSVARDLAERIPGARLTERTGRGHYFLYEPGEMESVLRELRDAHQVCAVRPR